MCKVCKKLFKKLEVIFEQFLRTETQAKKKGKSNEKKSKLKKTAAFTLAAVMSISMMSSFAFAEDLNAQDGSSINADVSGVLETASDLPKAYAWADNIENMLEDREYAEGEVIVIYDNSRQPELSLLDDGDEFEELTDISGSIANETFDDLNVKNKEDAVSVCVITSDDKSTRELLEELKNDRSVISAEPSYIYQTSDSLLDDFDYDNESVQNESLVTEPVEINEDAQSTGAFDSVFFTGEIQDLIKNQGYGQVGDLSVR